MVNYDRQPVTVFASQIAKEIFTWPISSQRKKNSAIKFLLK